jgi:dihydroxy-acid dehydratase
VCAARRAGIVRRRPLAFVQDGDIIELDVPGRRLGLAVSDEELARRRAGWQPRHRFTRAVTDGCIRSTSRRRITGVISISSRAGQIPEPEIH